MSRLSRTERKPRIHSPTRMSPRTNSPPKPTIQASRKAAKHGIPSPSSSPSPRKRIAEITKDLDQSRTRDEEIAFATDLALTLEKLRGEFGPDNRAAVLRLATAASALRSAVRAGTDPSKLPRALRKAQQALDETGRELNQPVFRNQPGGPSLREPARTDDHRTTTATAETERNLLAAEAGIDTETPEWKALDIEAQLKRIVQHCATGKPVKYRSRALNDIYYAAEFYKRVCEKRRLPDDVAFLLLNPLFASAETELCDQEKGRSNDLVNELNFHCENLLRAGMKAESVQPQFDALCITLDGAKKPHKRSFPFSQKFWRRK